MKKALKWIIGIPVGLFILFMVLVFAGIMFAKTDPQIKKSEARYDSLKRANEMAEQVAKQQEDDCLTAYVKAEMGLKKTLKDPDSYEEIEHKSYVVKSTPGDKTYIQVLLSYRAKNSFGGYVVKKRYFDFDKGLSLINTFEE